jgi:hypothetical protein
VAYSAEMILAFRAMPWRTITGTPKAMFSNILKLAAESAPNIIIQPGALDDKPDNFGDDLRVSAYDHIKGLAKNSGMDWDVTGQLDSKGNLQLFGNLYARKGVYTGETFTNLNSELSSPALTEQGAPGNEVFGHSQASTNFDRLEKRIVNQAAYDDYGALQLNTTYMGIHDAAGLESATTETAARSGRPSKMLRRTALDTGSTFSLLNTGNEWNIFDTTVGFMAGGGFGLQERVKIISMDYNDLSNKVPLNVEVI